MLDMGDTVEEIAKATGFSKSKVEKRAKLAVFDEAAFAESEKRNPTMKDYLDLAKVEDADERNKLLESIGTANFRDDLARAKSRIKSRKEREAQIAVIETFAQRVENEESDFRSVRTIYSNDKAADIKAPTDLDIHEYFYVEKSWAIMVYRRKTPGEISAAKDAEQEAAKLKAAYLQLEEASKRTFELRIAFMEALTAAKAKKCFATIAKHLADYLRDLTFRGYVQLKIDHHLAADLLGVSMAEKTGVDADEVKELAQKYPERTLLILCYLQLEDNNLSYAKQEWKGSKWVPFHRDCDGLDRIYELLTDIGYQMSDEEKQLQDGTHPLFYQEQPKQENAAA